MSTNMKFTGMEGSDISSPSLDNYHCLSFIMSTSVLFQSLTDAPSSPIRHFPHLHIHFLVLAYDQFFLPLCFVFPLLPIYLSYAAMLVNLPHVLLSCLVKHFLAISSIIYLCFSTHYCCHLNPHFNNLSSFLS